MRIPAIYQRQQEPIGIVIADGGRSDSAPRFSAFVWSTVPEESDVREDARNLIAAT